MSKFNLYEIKGDWNIANGYLISSHKTKELAIKRMEKEAKKRIPKVYYYRHNMINEKLTIVDYGSYNRFLAIEEVDE